MPPRPPPAAAELGPLQFLRVARRNTLQLWPESAYEQDAQISRFFGRPRVLLNAPAAIRRVLVDNIANYRRSPASIRLLRPVLGRGLVLSDGEAWRVQRRTVAPALAPRVIPVLAGHIAAAAADAVTALRDAPAPVDLLAATQRVALAAVGRAMFSLETRAQGTAMRELLETYAAAHAQPHLLDMLLPTWIITPHDLGRRRFRRRWTAFMDGLIAGRLAEAARAAPRDLFDLLRQARDPETGDGFSPAALRDQVATMIVAGHETTAAALFWALTLLAGDPAAQGRVAEEVRDLELGPGGAAAALGRLTFTRAVVSETLRLYPPAPMMALQAIGPDRVGEVDLPRGGLAVIAPWVVHRHRRLWRDPEVFDPARFLPDAPPPPRFAYLPFGAGPRICVAAQFALAEACLVLGALVQAFRIEKVTEPPVLPVAVITLRPDHVPGFRLSPR